MHIRLQQSENYYNSFKILTAQSVLVSFDSSPLDVELESPSHDVGYICMPCYACIPIYVNINEKIFN